MFRHVGLRELNPNSKETSRKHYPHYLQCNCVGFGTPGARIEYVDHIGAQYNAKCCSKDNLVDVELDM